MKQPTVSVVLPVYNAGGYLEEAVMSVLYQTFTSFELLILDDGSTDGCTDFLKGVEDERIRLIRRKHNYIATLNYGLRASRGKYIARMDADDAMFPNRLEEQVAVMEADGSIDTCSSYMKRMGGEDIYNSGVQGTICPFSNLLLLGNFISHPTVMVRTEYIREHGLKYRPKYIYAEDYKLWAEIAMLGGTLYIIPKPLLEYRVSQSQVSCIHNGQQAANACMIRNELLLFLIKNMAGRYAQHLKKYLNAQALLNEDGLLDEDHVFYGYYQIFSRIFSENGN